MEQEKEAQEPQLRELQEEASLLRRLSTEPGYKYLIDIATSQIDARRKQFETKPLQKMDEVLEQEYRKGEIAGILLFTEIVSIRLKDLEEDIQEILQAQETKDVSTTDDATDGDSTS